MIGANQRDNRLATPERRKIMSPQTDDKEAAKIDDTVRQPELIAALEAEEQTLLLKLSECRKNITIAKLDWVKSMYGVAVGSVVQDSKGNIYKVTSIDTRWKGRPWLQGHLKKKDGALFGIGVRNVHSDWTLLSP